VIRGARVVIHASPHPDDELIGAGATLMALRDAGWRIVNVACGLGQLRDRDRRRAELIEACRRARFELEIPHGLPGIGREDDFSTAQRALAVVLADAIDRHQASLAIGPSSKDGHHGHEVVGRALQDAVLARGVPFRLMFWGLWADLGSPNVLVGFDADRLAEIQTALSAHAGELARNPYDRLVRARAEANAVLGAERVFGFGAPRVSYQYAELLTEFTCDRARGLVPSDPHELIPGASLKG
jgi:LmbE family N-acetylglucosaminyl deacetylase